MNSCQNLSSVNLSNCQGGIFLRNPKLSDKKSLSESDRLLSYDYPRYFIRIFALPESRSLVIDFSRI